MKPTEKRLKNIKKLLHVQDTEQLMAKYDKDKDSLVTQEEMDSTVTGAVNENIGALRGQINNDYNKDV